MCIKRWKEFKPTDEYLSIVNELNTVEKLRNYMEGFKYVGDTKKILFWNVLWDHWQTPIETLKLQTGDCEDMAIFAVDVLVRVLKISDARFISYVGTRIAQGHAITVFPYKDKLYTFSNDNLIAYGNDYIEIGHLFFEKGLKYMEIRNFTGEVLERKFKLIGTF